MFPAYVPQLLLSYKNTIGLLNMNLSSKLIKSKTELVLIY